MSIMLIGTFCRLVSTDIAASKKSATSKNNSALFLAFVTFSRCLCNFMSIFSWSIIQSVLNLPCSYRDEANYIDRKSRRQTGIRPTRVSFDQTPIRSLYFPKKHLEMITLT